jgi:hypothetical protein
MTSTDATPVAAAQLPTAIAAYLAAHDRRDVPAALACFGDDPTVIDDGRTYRGVDAIRDWLDRSGAEYQYTARLLDAARTGAERYVVRQRLEGNFPGGVVDLAYRFALVGRAGTDGVRIAELVIAP